MSSSSGQGQDAAGALAVTAESRVRGVSVTRNIRGLFSHVRVENLVAGLSGGAVSTLVLHPLDLVKVRFAVSDGLELRPKYYSVWHCMRSIWKQEGLRGLYQGVTPNVWGAGASWGLYFFFYSAIKAYVQEGRQTELSPKEHLVSAAQAGTEELVKDEGKMDEAKYWESEQEREAHSVLQAENEEMKETLIRQEELLKVSLSEAEQKLQKAEASIVHLEAANADLTNQLKTLRVTVNDLENLLSDSHKERDKLTPECEREREAHSILQALNDVIMKTLIHKQGFLKRAREIAACQKFKVTEK